MHIRLLHLFVLINTIAVVVSYRYDGNNVADLDCSQLPQNLKNEIAGYEQLFRTFSDIVLNGPLKNIVYRYLGGLADTYGPRFVGTDNLENAIQNVKRILETIGLENVHTENVTVPVWKRGNESLFMVQPRVHQLAVLGLGGSVGTPDEGITANVIVVKTFEELKQRASQVSGKIVVYNQDYIDYGTSVVYRSQGASTAARYGAVAALVRSITNKSIYSPHTGWQTYDDNVTHIPVACITVEDAEMFYRITGRGQTVTVTLKMDAETFPDAVSHNVLADLTGESNPEEVVILSGHMDSWDVGQGAIDDGGGMYISALAPFIPMALGLRPKRTLRAVLWTGEEPGLLGAFSYRQTHQSELDKINIVLESDEGTYDPTGLSFTGSNEAACILKEILNITASTLNATDLSIPDQGSDTAVFRSIGIPSASLTDKNFEYFYYHHSNGDTMTQQNPDSLDRCLVFWSFIGYVLADLSVTLPRNNMTTNVHVETNNVK